MRYKHTLWPSLTETNKIARKKREAKKELKRLTDKDGKNLLLDYSGENNA